MIYVSVCSGIEAATQAVATFPINTQMSLRGSETSNTSREGIGLGANGDPAFTLQAAHHHAIAHIPIAWSEELTASEGVAGKIQRGGTGGRHDGVMVDYQVRRLTPNECHRLQGFPDDFCKIPWRNKDARDCPDGPQYKALGNSMAVNCMRWIGQRISMIEQM